LLRYFKSHLAIKSFDLEAFDHYPTYDPVTGTVASFIVSLMDQDVTIDGVSVHFEEGSVIQTEVSMKYDRQELEELGDAASLRLEEVFMDSAHNYCLALYHK